MRKIYRNFITKEEAVKLIKDRGVRVPLLEVGDIAKRDRFRENDIAKRVVEKLKEDFDFNVKDNSYWSIESKLKGHKWHKDTGSNNHMMWCQVGVSILLKDGSTGGETFYGQSEDDPDPIKSDRNLYDLVAHSSDEWHMVTPHEGNRIVFLMFI